MPPSMPRLRSRCFLLLMAAAGAASAQENSPYYIGVNQAFSYDSNVFRQVDALAKASSWSTTALVALHSQARYFSA